MEQQQEPLTEEERRSQDIELGVAAEQLLQSAPYMLIVNHLYNDHLGRIVQSEEHERKLREDAYFSIKAITSLDTTLKQMVFVKDQHMAGDEKTQQEDNE